MRLNLGELGSNCDLHQSNVADFFFLLEARSHDSEVVGVVMRLKQVLGQEFNHPRGV
jgi:hypothetical protein